MSVVVACVSNPPLQQSPMYGGITARIRLRCRSADKDPWQAEDKAGRLKRKAEDSFS